MSWLLLLLAIPLTLFIILVAPIWLWLHYRASGSEVAFSQTERQLLETLQQQARQMNERIRVLESILDEEQPDWRQS
ncbi:MAG: envelope stress response membrane protein PspB [Enterobacteriaceae bacterium]